MSNRIKQRAMNVINYWYKKYMALKETEKIPKPELTWKDVRDLCNCFMDVGLESDLPARSKEFYIEVLDRFNKSKDGRK